RIARTSRSQHSPSSRDRGGFPDHLHRVKTVGEIADADPHLNQFHTKRVKECEASSHRFDSPHWLPVYQIKIEAPKNDARTRAHSKSFETRNHHRDVILVLLNC